MVHHLFIEKPSLESKNISLFLNSRLKEALLPGPSSEIYAEKYLQKKGYLIIDRNWRDKIGEIDIIALRKRRLVFIEVKARNRSIKNEFRPVDAVDRKKELKIRSLMRRYLFVERVKLRKLRYRTCRFDIIGITFYQSKFGLIHFEQVNHLEDAF